MRKIFVKMASLILILVLCLSFMAGCGLVTTDTEEDMNQEVAIIQIDGTAPIETIYKKDMIMAYLNYGYMYEQYYGYSREQTFTLIIDSLVNNRIFVQNAIKELQKTQNKTSWNAVDYLDDKAKIEAEYNTVKAMNDLIESYKTQPDAEKSDSAWETVRTVPTNAANKEKEVDKKAYVEKGIIIEDSVEFRNAYNKVIELLRVNELLGDYDSNSITTTDYYNQTLKNNQEAELIEAYEKSIRDSVRAKFNFEALKVAYAQKFDQQASMTNTQLVEKFSSATASDPILFGANGNYGYVYNLLIGADDILTAEISSIKEDLDKDNITKLEYANARKAILDATVIKDQRSSWITSGYDLDYNKDTKVLKFTGDYTFAEDANNSLPFFGSVEEIKAATEDESAKYKVTDLYEFDVKTFVAQMENYVYGATTPLADDRSYNTAISAETGASIYKRVINNTAVTEYENKMNELLFAFSTDPGSLNTYKGYLIKPVPEGSDAEEYMQEFADGARELITMGGTSYIMVATDYGYHIMFYSEILNNTYKFDSLVKYLNDLYGDKDEASWKTEYDKMLANWDDVEDTENYLYLLANSLSSTEVTNAITNYQRDTLNTYRYVSDGGVTLFSERYADLLA